MQPGMPFPNLYRCNKVLIYQKKIHLINTWFAGVERATGRRMDPARDPCAGAASEPTGSTRSPSPAAARHGRR